SRADTALPVDKGAPPPWPPPVLARPAFPFPRLPGFIDCSEKAVLLFRTPLTKPRSGALGRRRRRPHRWLFLHTFPPHRAPAHRFLHRAEQHDVHQLPIIKAL